MASPVRPYTEVSAEAALRFFRGQTITVQVATAVQKTGEDGKVRTVFETKDEPLAASHVLSAKQWPNERITITTTDGRRPEAKGTVPADKAEKSDRTEKDAK